MTTNQRRSYTEILEILNNIKFLKSKVPNSLIEKMQLEKDNDWNFKYDEISRMMWNMKNPPIQCLTAVWFGSCIGGF